MAVYNRVNPVYAGMRACIHTRMLASRHADMWAHGRLSMRARRHAWQLAWLRARLLAARPRLLPSFPLDTSLHEAVPPAPDAYLHTLPESFLSRQACTTAHRARSGARKAGQRNVRRGAGALLGCFLTLRHRSLSCSHATTARHARHARHARMQRLRGKPVKCLSR
eukprot:364812-Chlamydomonas_euryale.AAC.7